MDSRNRREDPMLYKTFLGKYLITKKLGEGSFGKIYQGEYGEEKFALKFESRNRGQSLLESEAYIMSYLKGRNNNKIYNFSGYPSNKALFKFRGV